MARLAVDIGGTFTDVIYLDDQDGEARSAKTPTLPENPVHGVLEAIRILAIDTGEIQSFVHGNTLVVNIIIERKGAKTALVTTAGFRDVLEIGRGGRTSLYDFTFRKPEPFVPRDLRFEVRERISPTGKILSALALTDADKFIDAFRFEGVESVAIQFLHSYAEPQHEILFANYLAARLPGIAVTTSSELTREWREYERANTAVLNAYVQPATMMFLDKLEASLVEEGFRCPIVAVQSNGGQLNMSTARKHPISLIESGPAAGIGYAKLIAEIADEPDVIFFDVGGTTAKCSVLKNREVAVTTNYRLEETETSPGYPVKIPVVDVVEIGTGGGSIANVNSFGVLNVGPRSAGAMPGPACFDRGGHLPTITDAMLHLGILNPQNFAGGQIRLNVDKSRKSLSNLARDLNMDVDEAASGILRVANANMINALRLVSVRRGHDPRDFALIAMGGGGPMHAAALGQQLGVRKIIVPPNPGYASAWGMFTSAPRRDFVRTSLQHAETADIEGIDNIFRELEEQAMQHFEEELARSRGNASFRRSLDARYVGQEHVVNVPIAHNVGSVDDILEGFRSVHERNYTFTMEQTPVELVNFKLTAEIHVPRLKIMSKQTAKRSSEAAQRGERIVNLGEDGIQNVRIFVRDLMPVDLDIAGPVIVEEPSATTVVLPTQRLRVDEFSNLHITQS